MATQNDSIAPLTINLFGKGEMLVQGKACAPRPKSWWLLALIVLNEKPLNRKTVAIQLWPDSSNAESADYNLRRELSRLRGNLGSESYRLPDGTITLDMANSSIDVHRFRSAATSSNSEDWREAIELYQNGLLAGYPEDWCKEERQKYQEDYHEMLKKLAGEAVKIGNYEYAIDYSNKVIAITPDDEIAYQILMRSYLGLGQTSMMQSAYTRLNRQLERVGKTPSLETREIRLLSRSVPTAHSEEVVTQMESLLERLKHQLVIERSSRRNANEDEHWPQVVDRLTTVRSHGLECHIFNHATASDKVIEDAIALANWYLPLEQGGQGNDKCGLIELRWTRRMFRRWLRNYLKRR